MSRKSKIDSEKKVEIVERVLADEISLSEAARLTGVDMASIRSWRNLYLSDGPTALMAQPSKNTWREIRYFCVKAINEALWIYTQVSS